MMNTVLCTTEWQMTPALCACMHLPSHVMLYWTSHQHCNLQKMHVSSPGLQCEQICSTPDCLLTEQSMFPRSSCAHEAVEDVLREIHLAHPAHACLALLLLLQQLPLPAQPPHPMNMFGCARYFKCIGGPPKLSMPCYALLPHESLQYLHAPPRLAPSKDSRLGQSLTGVWCTQGLYTPGDIPAVTLR